jgi:solute carrier family 39 (zinc transporter), member 1/2/3
MVSLIFDRRSYGFWQSNIKPWDLGSVPAHKDGPRCHGEVISCNSFAHAFEFLLTGAAATLNQSGGHGHSKSDHELGQRGVLAVAPSDPSGGSDTESGEGPSKVTRTHSGVPGREDDFTYPPGGEDHLGHQRDHDLDDHFAAQMTAIFILEFGVIFHSIFIGLTLAVTGDEFDVLYIVLVFHQTFEGLGLGSRLATAQWPKKKSWMPWVLGAVYGFTTPIAIAIGLGVRESFTPGSPRTLIVNGIFDSISAGILIYTGLVELMAHEFMFNPEMRKSSIKMMLFAYACMCLGAGLMALLGKWA